MKRLVREPEEEPGDLEASLLRICRQVKDFFAADYCIVFAMDPVVGVFRDPIVASEEEADWRSLLSLPRPAGLTNTLLARGVTVVEDLEAQPEYASEFSRARQIRSFAALPLRTMRRQRPLAMLYLDSRTAGYFGPDDTHLLEDVANVASRHLQNAWFLNRNQQVARAGQAINRERFEDPRQLFDTLVPFLAQIVDCSHLCLLALRHRRPELFSLYFRHARQPGETVELVDQKVKGGWNWLLERRRSLLIRELHRPLEPPLPPDLDLGALPLVPAEPRSESLLFVPLVFGDKPLGLLAVAHPAPWAYEEEERQTLELLANHLALTINNHRLFADLGRLDRAGAILTQNLESEKALELVVEEIRKATQADLVLLYPYLRASESFDVPPRRSGKFLAASSNFHSQFVRPDDIAALAIGQREPVFAPDSTQLYLQLGGDPERRRGNFEVREEVRSSAAVPLLVGDAEPVGVLFINFRSPQSFDDPQRRLFGSLASYAAIAIKNSREFGALSRRHIDELETLQAIDRELSRFDNLDELLNKILREAKARIPAADIVSILLYDAQRKELLVEAAVGQESRKGVRLPVNGNGLAVRTFKEKRILLANDVSAPDWQGDYCDTDAGTCSELDVPLLDRDEVCGILNLESRQIGAFKEPDVRFASTLAGQAVLAVRQAQALETQTRLAKAGEILIELGKELTRQLDVQRVLDLIIKGAIEHTGAHAGALLLLDRNQRLLKVAAEQHGSLDHPMRLDEGIIGLVARQQLKLNVGDVTEPTWSRVYLPAVAGTRSELAVPLLAGDELKGVLNVESPETDHFNDRHVWLIEALADFAVIALQNAERFEHAEKRGRRLKALYDEAHQVIQQLENPELLMQAIVEHARKLTGATQVDLDLYANGQLHTTYQAREGAEPFKRFDLSGPEVELPQQGITRYVAQTRRSYRTHGDAGQDPLYQGDDYIQSELAVPLLKGSGDLVGVLNVESPVPDLFDDDVQEALELYAAQAVVAIENTFNFAQAQRERQRFARLLEASQELEKITDPEQADWAYATILRIVAAQYKSQVVIRQFKSDRLIRKVAAHDSPETFEEIPVSDQLNGWVARNRQPLMVPDFNELPPERRFRRSNEKDRAFLVVPIQIDRGRSYFGNLALSHEKPYYFQHADVELLSGLAQHLAFTLHRLDEDLKHQEAMKQAGNDEVMSRVGHQAYEIAHRMGNEFGPVKSYVRRIRQACHDAGLTDAKVEGYLREIDNSAEWLLDVSGRLQKESTRSAEPSLVPVRELIEGALGALRLETGEGREITLAREIPAVIGKVFIDLEPVTAALINLLNNAVEAMPGGGVLTVGAEQADRRIRIWVRDTGGGIAPENQKKIFTLFYSTKGKSRGFGLWSVQGNVKAQGGTLEVKSDSGQGATFTIELPRVEETEGGRA